METHARHRTLHFPPTAFVETAEFSPNGQWLTSLGREPCVRLWDVSARQSLTNLGGVETPAGHNVTLFFSPNNRLLVATIPREGDTSQLYAWDTKTWQRVAWLPTVGLPAFFFRRQS